MPVDGPQAILHAEKAIPLVEPASQQASSVVKQWQEDLGAAAAATQPTPQHHIGKLEQQIEIQTPIEKPKESEVTDKTPQEPARANQLEAQAALKQYILDRANRRKGQRTANSDDEEDGEAEAEGSEEARQGGSLQRSRGKDGPVEGV